MEKFAMTVLALVEIIKALEVEACKYVGNWYEKELSAFRNALDGLLFRNDYKIVSQVALDNLEHLVQEEQRGRKINLYTIASLIEAETLSSNLESLLHARMDLDPFVRRIIAEIGVDKFRKNFFDEMWSWGFFYTVSHFEEIKNYFTVNELSQLIFDRYNYEKEYSEHFETSLRETCDWIADCDFIKLHEQLNEIASKTGKLAEFKEMTCNEEE